MKKAVMAVGNVLRGDDAIGQKILEKLEDKGVDRVDLGWGINLGLIKKYDLVAIIDAGFIGAKPGGWGSFSLKELKPSNLISTHGINIVFLLQKMKNLPEIRFFLIQPERFDKMSQNAQKNVPEIVKAIKEYLNETDFKAQK